MARRQDGVILYAMQREERLDDKLDDYALLLRELLSEARRGGDPAY